MVSTARWNMANPMARFQTPVRVLGSGASTRAYILFLGIPSLLSTGIDQGRSARKVESKTRRTESGPPQSRHTVLKLIRKRILLETRLALAKRPPPDLIHKWLSAGLQSG